MKFGIQYPLMLPELNPAAVSRRYAEFFDELEWVDEQDFDSIWITEHHFSNYSISASPLLLLTKASERVRRARLGTAILVLPLWDPVRLVADVSTLDVLTGGRLDIGIGRGYAPHESWGFGSDPAHSREQFEEAVRLILQLFDKSDTTFHGEHYDVPVPVTVIPRPVQSPRPPIWMAASSPASIQFAADNGFHFMTPTNWTTPELAVQREFVEKCILSSGFPEAGREFETNRFVYCGTDEDELRLAIRASALQTTISRALAQGHTPTAGVNPIDYGSVEVEAAVRDRFIIGSPEEIVAQLKALGDAGVTYVLGQFRYGDLSADVARKSLELFTAEVLPHVAGIPSRSLVTRQPEGVAK